jgi:hypothetical protein
VQNRAFPVAEKTPTNEIAPTLAQSGSGIFRWRQKMSDAGQESVDRLAEERKKTIVSVCVTSICIILFILDLSGLIKVDGWAFALLVIAVIPWSFSTLLSALRSFGKAFGESNIQSVEIGAVKIQALERRVSEQDRKIDQQRRILDDLTLYSMAYYIYDKLTFLYFGTRDGCGDHYREYKYVNDEPNNHDLRYLSDHGYLEMFQLAELKPGENLVGRLKVTEIGQRFVELKEGRLTS